MPTNQSFGRRLRTRRLYHHGDDRLFVVPLDHSVSTGPITEDSAQLIDLIGQLTENGVDAVILHKGSLLHVNHEHFARSSLIVHLSASTVHAPDPNAKFLVASVEESLRLGADGVSVHVNLGSESEMQQVADLGTVADACDRWNVPLLAMMYPRGHKIADPHDPAVVAHAVALAAEMGADIAKTVHVGSAAEMADVTRSCPIPVIVAGGPKVATSDEVLDYVQEMLDGGAAGVAMGRNIFQASDPGAIAGRIADVIHHKRGARPELKVATG